MSTDLTTYSSLPSTEGIEKNSLKVAQNRALSELAPILKMYVSDLLLPCSTAPLLSSEGRGPRKKFPRNGTNRDILRYC